MWYSALMSNDMRSKPARGRPRLFDEDVVLDKIANVFWEKGFAGTSIDDLTEAAGIKRPSLYASFGDKKASFYAALAHSRRRLEALIKEFEEAEILRLGLTHFFQQNIADFTQGTGGQRGSFILTVAMESVSQSEIKLLLAEILGQMDKAFRRRFSRAIADGEIADHLDPMALTMMTTSTLQGLALRARAGASSAVLQELSDRLVLSLTQVASAAITTKIEKLAERR